MTGKKKFFCMMIVVSTFWRAAAVRAIFGGSRVEGSENLGQENRTEGAGAENSGQEDKTEGAGAENPGQEDKTEGADVENPRQEDKTEGTNAENPGQDKAETDVLKQPAAELIKTVPFEANYLETVQRIELSDHRSYEGMGARQGIL